MCPQDPGSREGSDSAPPLGAIKFVYQGRGPPVQSRCQRRSKIRSQVWLKGVGARLGTAGWLCRKPECTR